MKKNENIYISLELQKDLESKGLLLSVQFDRNAPNFLQENEMFNWIPTRDELDFISEAFELIGNNTVPAKKKEETHDTEISSDMDAPAYSHRSSELRIAPLPNNMTIEVTEGLESSHVKNRLDEEKIFIQADERKIDEILKRKKNASKHQYADDSDDKAIIDKMIKQKKKK